MGRAPIDRIDYINWSDETIAYYENLREQRSNHPYEDTVDIRRLSSGTPETYYAAVGKWNYFVDFYQKFYAPYEWNGILFELDVIIDIAPKINDKTIMKKVLSDIETINLGKYDKRLIWAIFNMADALLRFRQKWITHSPAKQKELVEILSTYIPQGTPPNFSDGTWYFYVWRQFGIVHIEKKGRYNYVTLPK